MKSKRAREAAEAEDKHVTPVDVEAPPKKRKRNDDDATTADVKKKAKKEKKDKKHKKESRKERKDKRKNLQDLPEHDDDDDDDDEVVDEPPAAAEDSPMADAGVKPASATADAADSDKAAKKKKNKDKKNKDKESQQEEEPTVDAEANDDSSSKKKKKKGKKDNKSSSTTANNDEAIPNGAEADTAAADDADSKTDRHIVFVGNLPFTATADTIQAHFASLSPIHVRCMSDPAADSKPCRGFAFVEFAKVWHMRTCLDKFHHSMFEDGVSPARRINVELTAGGGGKTKRRQEKIQEKNRKLDENRTKRIQREKTAKVEARANTDQEQHMEDAIHPSRRGRVPGNAW